MKKYIGSVFGFLGFVVVIAIALSGCGSVKSEYVAPAIIIPPNIKSIAVRHFANQTSVSSVGEKLWLDVVDEFIRDGRIAYTDDEAKADGIIVGTVTQYKEEPMSFDQNLVPKEYRLWVIMNCKFLDREKNQYIWEEPALEEKLQYFASTEPGGKTTEEARDELWQRFANDIVRRTIEGFGTVTSASPKSIPKSNVDPNPIPAYPSTVPF